MRVKERRNYPPKKIQKKIFFQEINSGADNGLVGKNTCPMNLRANPWILLWKEAHLKTLLTSTCKPTIIHIYTQNLREIQKLCKMN